MIKTIRKTQNNITHEIFYLGLPTDKYWKQSHIQLMLNSPYVYPSGEYHSVFNFYVPEEKRGKTNDAKRLINHVMSIYGTHPLSAQVSSKPSLVLFYKNGFRPSMNPTANLEESLDMLVDNGYSLNMRNIFPDKLGSSNIPEFKIGDLIKQLAKSRAEISNYPEQAFLQKGKLSKSKILPYGTKVKTIGGRILYILGNTFDDDQGDDTNYYVAKTMPKQGLSYIHHYTDMIHWADVAKVLEKPKKQGETIPRKKSTTARWLQNIATSRSLRSETMNIKPTVVPSRQFDRYMDLEYLASQIDEEVVEEYDELGNPIVIIYASKSKHSKSSLITKISSLGFTSRDFPIDSIDGYWKIRSLK